MPFNPSGIFERLFSWSADRDNGVKILADRHDSEDNNLAAGINAILAGDQPFRGPIKGAFGTVSAPGFTFNGDTDTGLYRPAADVLGFTVGGVERAKLTPAALDVSVPITPATGTVAAPGIAFRVDTDTGFFRPLPDELGFVTGGVERARLTNTALNVNVPVTGTAVTQSRSDLTAGRILKVGDYGLGTAGEIITDLNAINWTGICRFGTSTPNAPFTITGIVETVIQSSNQCRQFAYSHGDAKRVFTRCNNLGTWTPWVAIYNQANILDTVSQASGVPTGGLIERGSNGNGEYVRFADGTQICTTFINNDSVAWTTAEGSLFRSGLSSWTFPAAFVAGSSPAVSGGVEIGTRPAGAHFVSLAPTGVGWYGWTATSAAAGVNKRVMLTATGRWF